MIELFFMMLFMIPMLMAAIPVMLLVKLVLLIANLGEKRKGGEEHG